jgi:hypothetical protein
MADTKRWLVTGRMVVDFAIEVDALSVADAEHRVRQEGCDLFTTHCHTDHADTYCRFLEEAVSFKKDTVELPTGGPVT